MSSSADLTTSLLDDARALGPGITDLRHRLHREPELGLELPRTQEKVLAWLDGLGFEVSTGRGLSSVTAVLRGTGRMSGAAEASADAVPQGAADDAGAEPGTAAEATGGAGAGPGVVLLRGDMDALPVQERTGVPYASRIEGRMHACGHDLHTAMLAGAASLLAARRESLAGDVVLMFQPGEEGHDGAGKMIAEGVLGAAGPRPRAAFGLHVASALAPGGTLLSRPGTLMSASDGLFVTVRGAGGHGSTPQRAKDPVACAAEMVTALQTLITRQFNVFDPVVVTVGVFQAGTQRNIIPDSARFEATVRTFSREAREQLQSAVPRLLEGIAAAHGQDVEVEYREEYPVTVNDAGRLEAARSSAAELLGPERYVEMPHPLAGSEDFSRVLAEVPGAFLFLSAVPAGADHEAAAFNHSPYAVFDDAVLADGAALYARLAIDALAAG
ncbi:M20 family metallopeptidase [Zafaria sp. Z1313]|uniref:M20 metallopeptidase family protein n=1 Tax=unclassified Zafaria TaxID=2828765 RepID=UPI002E787973|nr:M20 family metallopeptidase [Zafaria sp. J156]MEE1622429.1 M20 family metallopeptidase [Zafaria sp. J156]